VETARGRHGARQEFWRGGGGGGGPGGRKGAQNGLIASDPRSTYMASDGEFLSSAIHWGVFVERDTRGRTIARLLELLFCSFFHF
jgi:hypothetical protein